MADVPSLDIGDSASQLRASLDALLAEHDQPGAVGAALDAVHDGSIGIADLYTRVLGPLLVDTGTAWQNCSEKVWEEHLASATVRTIVEALYPDVVRESAEVECEEERRVLLACPPGEQHDLGLRMIADRFALVGWHVFYLGADTPVHEIVDAAQTLDAHVVVLSASTHFNRVLLRSVVDEVQRLLPGVRLAVGGPAFVSDAEAYRGLLLDEAAFGLAGCELPAESEGEGEGEAGGEAESTTESEVEGPAGGAVEGAAEDAGVPSADAAAEAEPSAETDVEPPSNDGEA